MKQTEKVLRQEQEKKPLNPPVMHPTLKQKQQMRSRMIKKKEMMRKTAHKY